MKTLSLFRVELGRVFRSRATWLAVLLTALSLLGGFTWIGASTMNSIYLVFQIRTATLAGTLLFAILTLYEFSRVPRSRTDAIMDAAVSPHAMAAARLLAVQCAALAAAVLAGLAYLPYAVWKLGAVFSLGTYAGCFLILLFPGLFFGCLTAALCYQVFRRFDVSLFLVAAFLLFSRSGLQADRFLWQWSLPMLPALSDDFTNILVFRTALYSRLVWLFLFGGGWLLSLLCIRRLGKGLFGSLAHSLRRVWVPVLAAALLAGGGLLWRNQPFYDHTPVDWMAIEPADYTNEQVTIDGTDIDVRVENALLGTLSGTATFELENLSGTETPFFLELNTGYRVSRVTANGAEVPFEDLENDYIAYRYIRCSLPASRKVTLQVEYGGMPQVWNVFEHQVGDTVISPTYLYLNGKALAPAPEAGFRSEEVPTTLRFTMPAGLTPVTTGFAPELLSDNGDGTATWQIRNIGTTSLSLFAGDFVSVNLEGGGIPIEFWFSQKHWEELSSLGAFQTMEEAVKFCTERYGPRAFTDGKPFRILQGTEYLFGGFARDNISVISEESFTARNLSDTDKGAGGAEVTAHEIIHQWWGLGVMMMDPEDLFWSSEGLTTYTTYRLMKELRGEDYAVHHYLDPWRADVAENRNNFYVRHPEYLDILPEELVSNLKVETQGVNEYSGYALMFYRAAELLGGEDKLDAVLAALYQSGGGTEIPGYITLHDFLSASGLTKEALGLA